MITSWSGIAEGIQTYRDAVNAMVQVLIQDGFTDEQARVLTVAAFTPASPDEE